MCIKLQYRAYFVRDQNLANDREKLLSWIPFHNIHVHVRVLICRQSWEVVEFYLQI